MTGETRLSIGVLFVCTGNICRSPTAHGIFQQLLVRHQLQKRIHVDSAATESYHVGEGPDPRTQATALAQGVDLSCQCARQLRLSDFDQFQYLIAMGHEHQRTMEKMRPYGNTVQIMRLLDVMLEQKNKDMPDPYYGGQAGFEQVFALCESGCKALLEYIVRDKYLQTC